MRKLIVCAQAALVACLVLLVVYAGKEAYATKPARDCTNCYDVDRKCINGQCVIGRRVNTSSTRLPDGRYKCVYHYLFPDGSVSTILTDYNVAPCLVDEP
ncbi:hypothetical protein [Chitinophaga vietnamensis]|uniref:hypothetical protein n=1 Tax=Chitinophaga vietnamensis TaxID=2593957 RepID=UPI00117741C9|nr:hypothetical protein [Chitinophaga vietnamensis]